MELPGVPPDMRRKYERLKRQLASGYVPTKHEKLFLRNVEKLAAMYVFVNKPNVEPSGKPLRLVAGKHYRPTDFEFEP